MGCFILEDGSAIAWGRSVEGQRYIPDTQGKAFIQISTGSFFNVAILDDGSAVAWGYDRSQYSIPDTKGRTFVQVYAGSSHIVAILDDGSCVAWGSNDFGQCDILTWVAVNLSKSLLEYGIV